MKIGDYVVVTVEYPKGAENRVFGNMGKIIDIENSDFCVHDGECEFWYSENELRPATDEEIRLKLDWFFDRYTRR